MDQEPVITEEAPPIATPIETPPAPEEGSVADHAAEFGPQRETAPPDEEGEGERDAQGRFKPRHRAESQKARAGDVPRINELTKKLREAEAERDRLKNAPAVASQPAAPAQESRPAPSTLPAKPKPEDFQDYEAYLDARDQHNRQLWSAEQRVQEDNRRIIVSWKSRVDEAIKEYPDFEEVALKASTRIPPGSFEDNWVLKAGQGAKILYTFQKHPDEYDRYLALNEEDGKPDYVARAEFLTLLGQRLMTTRQQAALTGSAAAPPVPSVPRPPNPVRTGPMRTGDTPPGDEASVLDHARFFGPQRRGGR